MGLLRCSPVSLLTQIGVNGAFASPLPLSRLTLHILALSTGNDLNSVAIFEEAGGWHTERGAKDARQVR